MPTPAFNSLVWIVAGFSLAAGALALALSASALMRQRDVSIRLSSLIGGGQIRGNLLDILSGWTETLGKRLISDTAAAREIRDLLAKAGFFKPVSLYVFVVLRLVFAAAGAVVFVGWFGAAPVNVGIAIILAVLCYRYAAIAVKYLGERRAQAIQRELPSVLDIILMVLDSGVSIDQCLHYVTTVVGASAPTTAAVLVKHTADIDSGVPYDVALDRLGQRLAVDEGVDFANLLKQAIFQGGELGSSLRRFSAELADRRLARAREEGGRRATYLTIVMVLFFVPVLLVILMGPAAVRISETLTAAAHRAHSSEIRSK